MARTRSKSDLEVLEDDFFFISRRLSKRVHVNPRRRLGVDDGNHNSSEESQRHEPLLAVREAIVLESESRSLKYSGCIYEVQTMILQVKTTLPFVPGKPHRHSVYTLRLCVNLAAFALTIPLKGRPLTSLRTGPRTNCKRAHGAATLFHGPFQR